MVHAFMLCLICDKHESALQCVYMLIGKKHNGLIISGHSLGGAMATLSSGPTASEAAAVTFPSTICTSLHSVPRECSTTALPDICSANLSCMIALYIHISYIQLVVELLFVLFIVNQHIYSKRKA